MILHCVGLLVYIAGQLKNLVPSIYISRIPSHFDSLKPSCVS